MKSTHVVVTLDDHSVDLPDLMLGVLRDHGPRPVLIELLAKSIASTTGDARQEQKLHQSNAH